MEGEVDELASRANLSDWLLFRDSLRELVLANNEGEIDSKAVEALNRIIKSAKLTPQFDPSGHLGFQPGTSGIQSAMGQMIVIIFEAMQEGTWHRLKACSEDSCKWA